MSTLIPKPLPSQTPARPSTPLKNVEAQYRRFLARRWFSLVWRSAVWSGLVTGIAIGFITNNASGIYTGFLVGLLSFPLTLYPVMALHRKLLTSSPTSLSKTAFRPYSLFFSSLSSRSTVRAALTYCLFGLGFTTVYCQAIQLVRPDKKFGFTSPTPRHPLHLNERFIFLILGQIIFSAYLTVYDVAFNRIKAVWPNRRTPLHVAAQNAILEGLMSATIGVMNGNGLIIQLNIVGMTYSMSYFFFRRSVWTVLLTHFGRFLRPFIVNFARSANVTVTWSMVFHLQFLCLTSLLVMKGATTMINTYVTQPIDISTFSKKSPYTPDRYLLLVLEMQQPYYVHFTLMELLRVSHDPSRRKVMFEDSSKSGPYIHELWQALLIHLGQVNQSLTARPSGTGAPMRTVRPDAPSQPDPRSIAVKSGEIFKPLKKKESTIDFALQRMLDGPVTAQTPTPKPILNAEIAAKKMEGKAIAQLKGVKENVVGRIENTPVGASVLGEASGVLGRVGAWTGKEWAKRQVDVYLPDSTKAVWIIEILTTFIVASAEEDTYGYVQQVLPGTLEAFIRLRSSTLSLQSSLGAQAAVLGTAQDSAYTQAKTLLDPVHHAVQGSLRRTSDRFGKSLGAFKFPPSIAAALTEICSSES